LSRCILRSNLNKIDHCDTLSTSQHDDEWPGAVDRYGAESAFYLELLSFVLLLLQSTASEESKKESIKEGKEPPFILWRKTLALFGKPACVLYLHHYMSQSAMCPFLKATRGTASLAGLVFGVEESAI
jgi:hypothetical protein